MYSSKPYTRLSRVPETDNEYLTDEDITSHISGPASPTIYKPYRKPTTPYDADNTLLPSALLPGHATPKSPPDTHEVDLTESSSFVPHESDPTFPGTRSNSQISSIRNEGQNSSSRSNSQTSSNRSNSQMSSNRSISQMSSTRRSIQFRSTSFRERFSWQGSMRFHTSERKPSTIKPLSLEASAKLDMRKVRRIRQPWETGHGKRFPLIGFAALATVALLTGASAAVTLASGGTTMDSWKVGRTHIQPHVYISILEIATILFTLSALGGGVAIAFWRQLLHGTTLGAVHDSYESIFPLPAIHSLCRLRFNRIAIACVFSTLSLARGPLFQGALSLSIREGTAAAGQAKYRVSSAHVAAGIVASFACVIAVLPLYYGYWELGRNFTLNPLEIARAFGAPMFDGLDGNVTPQDIDFERGEVMVKYGALERYGCEKLLRVEETATSAVRAPWQGEIFG